MDMAKVKLTQLAQHGELLDRYGACVRVLGQRSLMKEDVLEAMDRACAMTAHNTQKVLNVCFPYTSRDEITTAIRETVDEYSKPTGHDRRNTGFDEEHISETITQQKPPQSPSVSETSLETDDSGSDQQLLSTESSPPSSYTGSPLSKPRDSKRPENLKNSQALKSPQNLQSSQDTERSQNSQQSLHPQKQQSSHDTQKTLEQQNPHDQQAPQFQNPEIIDSETITSHMFTATDPPLDLLIRTSGVERLSDFMLWQCHQDTKIVFLDVLWPEFDLWSFLPVLWEYQWRGRKEEQSHLLGLEGLKAD